MQRVGFAFSAVVLALSLSSTIIQTANAAEKNTRTGRVTLKLNYVFAVNLEGKADPAHDADCKKTTF